MVHERNKISVWLIEEHPLAAKYLMKMLKEHSVRLFAGRESLLRVRGHGKQPLIFLIDAESQRVPVEVYIRSAHVHFPEATILAMGRPVTHEDLYRLLFMGLQRFCSYEDVGCDLVAAVRSISEGHIWFPAEVLEKFAQYVSRLKNVNLRSIGQFTHGETLVVGLLQRRMSNKEISAALGISERTVRFHLGKVFAKLGVHDRYTAVDILKSGPLLASEGERARRTFSTTRATMSDRQAE
ncbi:MAG: helix-turn-helix transcriptional regulator [Terriglobia bacterium]